MTKEAVKSPGPVAAAASRITRRAANPAPASGGTSADILRLQRLAGNRFVASAIQREPDPPSPGTRQRSRSAPPVPSSRPPNKPVPDLPTQQRSRSESDLPTRLRSGAVSDVPPSRPPNRPPPLNPKQQLENSLDERGYTRNEHSYEEMLGQVNLGKKRSKLTKKSHYVSLLEEYVSLAQLRAAQIRKAADTLGYDYVSLQDLRGESKALTGAGPTKDKSVLSNRTKLLTAYKLIVNENLSGKKPSGLKDASPDFDVDWEKSISESAGWAVRASKARDEVEEERVNVEMLWSEVQDGGFTGEDKGAKQTAEAKLSLDRIEVMRQQLKNRVEYLTKIKRVQAAGGKILDAVGAGVMSFGLTLVTLGVAAVEKEFNPLFYKGAGWTWHSEMPTRVFLSRASLLGPGGKGDKGVKDKLPVASREEKAFKIVLMENLGGKIKSVKNMLGQRKGGANSLDWLSALLWFIGDGLLQSLMGVGSRIAIWITGLNILLNLINVPAHGALTPVIAVLTALALAITYVRMALAALKLVITGARVAVDSLNAAITKDPRMKQALKGRAIRSATGLLGDSLQLGGFAVVMGGDIIKEGLGMSHAFSGANNAFNPISDIHNVSQVHSDVLSHTNEISTLSGTFWEGEGIFGAGVVPILVGADAVPAIGEALSDSNDLNSTGATPYLGGSNQKSQNFVHESMEHSGRHGPGQSRSRTTGPVPQWMQQGKDREEQMGTERAEYLVKEANKKVTVSQSSVSEPMQKVGAAGEKSQQVGDSIDKVKNFFKGESKKKEPDVPSDQIAEQQQEAVENEDFAKGLSAMLKESVGAMAGFAG